MPLPNCLDLGIWSSAFTTRLLHGILSKLQVDSLWPPVDPILVAFTCTQDQVEGYQHTNIPPAYCSAREHAKCFQNKALTRIVRGWYLPLPFLDFTSVMPSCQEFLCYLRLYHSRVSAHTSTSIRMCFPPAPASLGVPDHASETLLWFHLLRSLSHLLFQVDLSVSTSLQPLCPPSFLWLSKNPSWLISPTRTH